MLSVIPSALTGGAWSPDYGSDADVYGKRPTVPNAPDYVASLKKITQGNIDLLPSLTDLATKSTKLYSDLLESNTPGIGKLKDKTTSIIGDWLEGKVPKDVQRQLSIFGAQRASQTGVGGDIGDSWTAQDFGNTSFAIQQTGVQAASRWLEQSRAGVFDFSKMFMGPQDAKDQADATFNRDWLASQVASAPDPGVRGAMDTDMAATGMFLGAYAGGAGYTGQYKSPYQGQQPSTRGQSTGQSYFGGSNQDQGNWNEGQGGAGAESAAADASVGYKSAATDYSAFA